MGSNMGNRFQMLEQAQQMIEKKAGKIIAASHVYETAAWGNENQNSFLNTTIQIETPKSAVQLLEVLQAIEKSLGRNRKRKWEPRLIDIDILFFNNDIIYEENLTVPHPQMHLRRFTLQPLAEIAGGFIHPVFDKTITDLLNECTDTLPVTMLTHAL